MPHFGCGAIGAMQWKRQHMYGAPGGGGWTPASLSGIKGWWRAEADVANFAEGADYTPWTDQTAENHDLAHPTATWAPLFRDNVKNGKAAGSWEGNSRCVYNEDLALTQPFSVGIVLEMAATATYTCPISLEDSLNVTTVYVQKNNGVVDNVQFRMLAPNVLTTTNKFSDGWYVLTMVFNGASSTMHVNGAAEIAGNVGANNATGIVLGSYGNFTSALWTNDIAEVIVMDGAISAGDRALWEAYVSTEYGITLSP